MIFKIVFFIIVLVVIDIILSIWRNYRRYNIFMKAKNKSLKTQKELVVIGDPNTGFWNKNVKKAYDCGDICIDLKGCNKCPVSITGDILDTLKKMPNNHYVIYESCVLEYVDQRQLEKIKKEIRRVSGGNYYQVRIKPNIFPTFFSFIEFGI